MTAAARSCRKCGKAVALTPSGHLRAHRCPHNGWCVVPYAKRREGVRGGACKDCRDGRQLRLFP